MKYNSSKKCLLLIDSRQKSISGLKMIYME